jgi:hypothetical protein
MKNFIKKLFGIKEPVTVKYSQVVPEQLYLEKKGKVISDISLGLVDKLTSSGLIGIETETKDKWIKVTGVIKVVDNIKK